LLTRGKPVVAQLAAITRRAAQPDRPAGPGERLVIIRHDVQAHEDLRIVAARVGHAQEQFAFAYQLLTAGGLGHEQQDEEEDAADRGAHDDSLGCTPLADGPSPLPYGGPSSATGGGAQASLPAAVSDQCPGEDSNLQGV
jgi:hypothetical protein